MNAVSLTDEGYLPPDKSVINLQYQPEEQALCIITDHGSAILWYVTDESVSSTLFLIILFFLEIAMVTKFLWFKLVVPKQIFLYTGALWDWAVPV